MKMIYDLLRVIAILVGGILVLGGGVCAAMFVAIPNGTAAGSGTYLAAACAFGVALIGVLLLKFAVGKEKAEPAPEQSNSGHDEPPGG